jgi:citrate lyase beta subunit
MTRPIQSVLYLPANRAGAIAKARTLPADAVILDLEDAVQPAAKPEARAAALAARAEGGWDGKQLLLRVNGLGTAWGGADFAACAGFDGVVVPKINSAEEAAAAVRAANSVPVWAMIETPRGVLAAAGIAATSGIVALLAGMADLAKDLQARPDPARMPLLYSLSAIVVAARAAGIACYDGVYTDIQNAAGFEAEARQGQMLGFDGKTLIHPSQVEPCNTVFAPTEAEIADAEGMIAAYDAALAAGAGVATYKGRMVEVLHVAEARRLLEGRR